MSAEHKVKCKECGKEFVTITNTHLKKHELTIEEYRKKYPNDLLSSTSWLNQWRGSEANTKNLRSANKIMYSSKKLRNKRKKSLRKFWEKADSRSNHSRIMKRVIKSNPEKFKQCFNAVITARMRMSNYDRWVEDFGLDIANKKLKAWKRKNKLPSKSKATSLEKLFESKLVELGIEYTPQYDKIGKYWCDFYLPKYNLIVEVDGDYWHANPEQFSEDDLIGPKKTKAKYIWEYDNQKTKDIIDAGYNIFRIYGSRLKKLDTQELYEDIVQTSKRLGD